MHYNKRSKSKKGNLIYGVHPIFEALEAGRTIEKVLISRDGTHVRIREIRQLANEAGIPVQMVPDASMHRLCPDANHQGILAFISAITYQPLEAVLLSIIDRGEEPLLLLLDGVTDVRNFGAIARTAECLGAHALIVPAKGAAAGNADAVKVSAGALNHLAVCRQQNLVDALLLLQAYGIPVLACTEKAAESVYDLDLSGPRCLVFGSEEKGVSRSLLKRADTLARIPMTGQVESLNVSVSAGIVLGEVVRQRRLATKQS